MAHIVHSEGTFNSRPAKMIKRETVMPWNMEVVELWRRVRPHRISGRLSLIFGNNNKKRQRTKRARSETKKKERARVLGHNISINQALERERALRVTCPYLWSVLRVAIKTQRKLEKIRAVGRVLLRMLYGNFGKYILFYERKNTFFHSLCVDFNMKIDFFRININIFCKKIKNKIPLKAQNPHPPSKNPSTLPVNTRRRRATDFNVISSHTNCLNSAIAHGRETLTGTH